MCYEQAVQVGSWHVDRVWIWIWIRVRVWVRGAEAGVETSAGSGAGDSVKEGSGV